MPTPDIPEGLELRKDGTIVLHLDDDRGRNQRIQLRRPKFKELRTLRQAEWDIADKIKDAVRSAQTELDQIDLDQYGDDIPRDVVRRVRDLRTQIERQGAVLAEDLRLGWAEQVIDLLADSHIDAENLPPWCATSAFASETLTHWLTVPTRRGSP